MRNFNTLQIPASILVRSAHDAAFAALATYRQAERELAQPLRSRSLRTIHADVLRTQRVAESLARRIA